MQLQRLRLHPFAGLAERTYEFGPGMNVVLGPNEAGKSTMVNGIVCALFESTSYGKLHWRKHLQPFVPRGGGDTFGVSLNCLVDGDAYQITKSWGGECRSELTLPSGQVIRSADEVDQNVASLLQLKRGTWQNILIAHQSAISSTLQDFDTEGEEASDLAQILRSSAFDTDGVSLEKLEHSINQQLDDVSSRWDLAADRPENGRGIENPWKQSVGSLLRAWYEHEQLKAELLEVEDHERNHDAINQQVSELIAERTKLQLYVDKFAPIVDGLKERQGLELKLDAAKKKEEHLRAIQTKWPLHEVEIGRLEKSLEQLDGEHNLLRKESDEAQLYQKSAGQRQKLTAAKEAEAKLAKAKEHLAAFKNLSPQLFGDLKTTIAEKGHHAMSMAARKLQVRFTPESDTKVDVKAGLEDSREEVATKDQPLHTEADGIVTLTTGQFKFEVESGDGQFSAIKDKYESAQARISELLSTIGVVSVDEAHKRETDYSIANTNLERANTALETILSGQTLAELASACGEEVSAPKRETREINNAILANRATHNQQQTELKQKRAEIKTWEDQFENPDAVLDRLLDARNQKQACEQKLTKLPPLPEGSENTEALQGEFNRKRGRLTVIKEEALPAATNQQSALKATEPGRTTQELGDLITEAESSYALQKRRLESLMRVKEQFQQMKSRLDSGTLDPWTKRLSQTIQQITSDRYKDLDFDGGGVTSASGIVIPHELLSMGTKASMGFCIRLSMAAHFLEGLNGFLILDDPMVDLDADRQRKTADVLQRFAQQKQVILLTCHEAHAALLTKSPLQITRDDGEDQATTPASSAVYQPPLFG